MCIRDRCNVATQAVAQIASSQYGGQSISLSHLVPFVQVSREKYRKEVAYEFAQSGIEAVSYTHLSGKKYSKKCVKNNNNS